MVVASPRRGSCAFGLCSFVALFVGGALSWIGTGREGGGGIFLGIGLVGGGCTLYSSFLTVIVTSCVRFPSAEVDSCI